ncbi:MAG: acyl-CoA dehydrogenase family protein [Reyranellaceae bacterium]
MSELAQMLYDTAGRLFADASTAEVINAAEKGEWPQALWAKLEELGLLDILGDEAAGGGGGSWADVAALLRRVGEFSVPLPVAETILARWLAQQAGLSLPAGPATLALLEHPAALQAEGAGWKLGAPLAGVAWGRSAKAVVVAFEADGALRAGLLPIASASEGRSVAGEPRDTLVPADTAFPARIVNGVSLDEVRAVGALTRVAMMAGAMQRAMALSIRYANERSQFGRSLFAFQAIQHHLAQIAEETCAAAVALELAAGNYSDDRATMTIAAAKVRAGEAAGKVAALAHQIHGAMGVTYEHTLHHSTRRLWAWRDEYGREDDWALRLWQDAAPQLGDGIWPLVVGATNREAAG